MKSFCFLDVNAPVLTSKNRGSFFQKCDLKWWIFLHKFMIQCVCYQVIRRVRQLLKRAVKLKNTKMVSGFKKKTKMWKSNK